MPIDIEKILDAIVQVESGGDPKAVGDKGKSLGAFQMQRIAFKDVQDFFPEFKDVTYEEVIADPELQREAAKAYLEVGQQKYGITEPDRLISFYNAGPRVRKGTIPNLDYLKKVKRQMGEPMPDKQSKMNNVEDGLRRIYMLTAQAGFGELSPREIESILEQVEPPKALPGVKKSQPSDKEIEKTAISQTANALKPMGGAKTAGMGTAREAMV